MCQKSPIIIIDDEEGMAKGLRDILSEEGYLIEVAFDGKSGLELCREKDFDIAFVDIKLPDIHGSELVKEIVEISPDTEFILMTGYATLESAVDAVKQKNVVSYEIKPFDMDRILVLVKEVIRRRQAELAFEESEKRYREMTELLPDMIYELDPSLKITYANHAAFNMVGYMEKDIERGLYLSDIMSKDDLKLARQRLEERAKGVPPSFTEYTLRRKDGSTITCENTSAAAKNEEGELVRFYGIMRDITKRKRAEEDRLRLVMAIEQVVEIIIITDKAGAIQYVNPAFEQISGFKREEIIGRGFDVLKNHTQDNAFYEAVWDKVRSGNVWNGRLINRNKDGRSFEVEATISPIQDQWGNVTNYVAVQRDVTHEVELERQLSQAQKMEAIGTLAGGISHDFNNILGAIIGYIEMMKMFNVPKDSPMQGRLSQVLNATDRAKALVDQILTFSRHTEVERKPIMLGPVIKEALKFLRASLPATIEICQEIKHDAGPVLADPTQMHQVLMNLSTNAAHAMSEKGGVLDVALEQVYLDDQMVAERFVDMDPGSYIRLTVKDTGHGIDREIIDRIFDPYFTTKETGHGTGMGLSVVHGIIKSHEGAITLTSESGKGTTFEIMLPIVEGKTVESKTSLSGLLPTGTERILFIDDEQDIVNIGQTILEHLGYNVVASTSSVDALNIFRNQPDQFDLVITDLTMPNMTGIELASHLLDIRSDIPIIICTGFSEALTKEKTMDLGIRELVSKPFSASELAEIVRKTLDQEKREAHDGNIPQEYPV